MSFDVYVQKIAPQSKKITPSNYQQTYKLPGLKLLYHIIIHEKGDKE